MPGATSPEDRRHRLDDLALRAGVVSLVAVAVLYVTLAAEVGDPLVAFVLPTLVSASIGAAWPTLVVGLLGLALATALGVADSELGTPELAAQLVVLAAGTGLGTVLARMRRRGEDELRDVAWTASLLDAFQRRLVPVTTPPSELVVRSRYVPGEDRLRLGGDFVDLIQTGDGDCAFVLGDVSGHGPDAAAFGAAVRAGWKSIAVAAPGEPVRWLETLQEAFFTDGRFRGFVTVLVGWIDLSTCTVHLASAGHCWPVLVSGAGADIVEMTPGVPLGVAPTPSWTTTSLSLAEGEHLVTYTDGLIENRRAGRDRPGAGETGLLTWMRRHGGPDGADLDRLLTDLGPEGFDDDVAVMTIGFSGARPTATAHPRARRRGDDPTGAAGRAER